MSVDKWFSSYQLITKYDFWTSLKGKTLRRGVAAGGSHRFKTVLFFWKYSGEHQQSYQITAASVLFYHQSSNRAISVVDGGGIADNCGEFIHFHYISSWNFAWKNRFFTLSYVNTGFLSEYIDISDWQKMNNLVLIIPIIDRSWREHSKTPYLIHITRLLLQVEGKGKTLKWNWTSCARCSAYEIDLIW